MPYPRFDGTQPCLELDPETFFPVTSRDTYFNLLKARPVCAGCPFLAECRDYAVSHDVHGFWGGMSRAERIEERKRLGIAPIKVTVRESHWMWDRLAEVDDGVTNSEIIAGNVGCSAATVQRWRRRQAGAA